MMKTKIRIYSMAAFLMVGVIFSSCKDFLEPKARNEFVPKDATSLNELLLGEAYPTYSKERMNVFLNLLDDDVSASPYQADKHVGYNANLYLAAYTWQPSMYEMMKSAGVSSAATDIYSTYYEYILGANAVIDYIKDVTDTQENIDYVLAQAYALRGFFYFKLMNIFGVPYTKDPSALGVPLKLSSEVETSNLKRNTVKQCYEQIEKDLLLAENLYKDLPEEKQWDANYRTSLPMVQLLLSRMYLYMEQWDKAASYADAVIQNPHFKLLDLNAIDAFDSSGRPIYYEYNSYTNSPEVIWLYDSSSDVYGWLEDNGENSEGKAIYAYFKASDELMNSFDETEGDLRKDRYVTRSWYYTLDKDENKVYMPQAFGKIRMASNNNWYVPAGGVLVFGYSFRLSEAYLNKAEAEAMLYKIQGGDNYRTEALLAANTLRKYRIKTGVYASVNKVDVEDLIEFVRNERRRELCFEDFRWYDLRRWGMKPIKHIWYPDGNTTMTYTLQQDDPLFTVPLPDVVLEKNSSLQQNPLSEGERIGNMSNK